MQLEVYESDREALDAAAAVVETAIRARTNGHAALAVGGGRGGRAIMVALAERAGIPWEQVRATVIDEPCVPMDDARSNRRLLRENLLGAQGRSGDGPAAEDAEPGAAYEAEVRGVAGADVAFDVIVLELGTNGEVGVLSPGHAALDDGAATFVRVAAAGADVERIGLGPASLARARRVVVLALGRERSHALRRVLDAAPPAREPARLLLPSERVVWLVDRAAASELLRDARPARA